MGGSDDLLGTGYFNALSRDEIWNYLLSGELVVTPLLEPWQIGRASMDIRLGNEFIVMKKTRFSGIDVRNHELMRREVREYQERVRVDYGEPFVLHPNEFILGSTLEYFHFPSDLIAFVIGRSSWGRLGIVNATATFIDPGFTGTITLELSNLGNLPLTLYPGLRIGQLVFYRLRAKVERYRGMYAVTVSPEFTKIYGDKDLPSLVPGSGMEKLAQRGNTEVSTPGQEPRPSETGGSLKPQIREEERPVEEKKEEKDKKKKTKWEKGFLALTLDMIAKR